MRVHESPGGGGSLTRAVRGFALGTGLGLVIVLGLLSPTRLHSLRADAASNLRGMRGHTEAAAQPPSPPEAAPVALAPASALATAATAASTSPAVATPAPAVATPAVAMGAPAVATRAPTTPAPPPATAADEATRARFAREAMALFAKPEPEPSRHPLTKGSRTSERTPPMGRAHGHASHAKAHVGRGHGKKHHPKAAGHGGHGGHRASKRGHAR